MRRTYATLALLFLAFLAPACGEPQSSAAERTDPSAAGANQAAGRTTGTEAPTQEESTVLSPLPTTTVTLVPSGGPEPVEVEAEVADDRAERQRGLMERSALAENAGMLFVFGQEQVRSFYMKNTLIPLSIAYIDAEGRIVDIQDMEPLDETSRRSAAPLRYALEVNQGFFEEHGIEVGDTVEIPEEHR